MKGAASSGASPVAVHVWVNGVRHSGDAPQLSARDRGFTLADGLFETILLRTGRPFRLDAHLDRLRRGMVAMDLPHLPSLTAWALAAADAAASSGLGVADDAGLRVSVTRGVGPAGLTPSVNVNPTVVITCSPLPSGRDAVLLGGLRGHIASGRRNEYSMTAGLKTLAYTENVAALLEARRAGADEAIFLDTDGHVSEATASNLFVWTGRELLTPPVSCGALAGITREAMVDLARAQGLVVAERVCSLDDLRSATEVFLTSSLRGVAPLVSLDGVAVGSGTPGPRTLALASAYEALVTVECCPR